MSMPALMHVQDGLVPAVVGSPALAPVITILNPGINHSQTSDNQAWQAVVSQPVRIVIQASLNSPATFAFAAGQPASMQV